MIEYASVEEQAQEDFHRACRKASLRRFRNRLQRNPAHDHLLSFEEAKGAMVRWTQAYRGMRTVEVEKIRGSVGKYRDFDSSFLPLKVSMGERWGRIDRAYHRGEELPAVSLYKIGDAYFVRDGNHRASVARYHGVAAIDAKVVELRGYTLTDAAQLTTRIAVTPIHRSQHLPEPGASRLHKLRQRLRLGLLRSGGDPQ